MNQDYIRLRISQVRKLIGDFRFKEAFEELEQFIVEMDGKEVEQEEERNLLDQLLMLKSRYNSVLKAQIEGVQENELEMNKITKSLLQLTNMVNDIGMNDPEKFKPDPDRIPPLIAEDNKEEEIVAYMAVAAPPTEHVNIPNIEDANNSFTPVPPPKKEKTYLSISETEDGSINIRFNGLRKTMMTLGFLLICGFAFYKYDISGLNSGSSSNEVLINSSSDVEKDEPVTEPPKETALCTNCKELNMKTQTGSAIADHISQQESAYPKRFAIAELSFNKNGAELNTAGKKALDDLALLLKAADGDASINIYGLLADNEKPAYQGNKEVMLDDVRARTVYDYLKKQGVDESKMEWQGDGLADDKERIEISITKQ